MSQAQEKIKWGDIIRLHGVSTVPGKQAKGLIISKGFTDPNIYYQTYSQYDEVNFYRESLFQIIPKSNFDLHDQLLFDEKVKQEEKANLRERAKEQITQLYCNLQGKYLDKQHPEGVNVLYGAEVVFRHIQSGEYLSGIFKAADIGEGAFKLELAKQLSSQLIFKLVSHRSYEHEGNDIYFDDCLRIYHPKTDCYMNFPDTEVSIIFDRAYEIAEFDREDKGYDYYQNRPSIKKPVGRRINVINENKPKCLWKFIQHCKYEDSLKKDKIKSHDIVYFQHTKEKGLIASTLAQQKYYLKELRSSTEETVSYECFWELIPKEGNELGPEKCNLFWARNIVTGQILTYNGYKVEIESKQNIEDGGFKSEGLVNLICGESEESGRLLLERGKPIRNEENVIPVIKYFDQTIIKMQFDAVPSLSEDSFIIVRVSEDTIRDVSYILSSQEAFVKVVEILSTELKKKQNNPDSRWIDFFSNLDDDLLFSFISVLKLLAGKIYDTDYNQIESSGNSPIRQIQKILVETGIAQLLMQIIFTLYDPFHEIVGNDQITDDRPKRMKVAEIFELSYILVQNIVKDFEDNKIYFSRWVDLFIEHSNRINKTFIQECLVAILKNNPVSIKWMINADTINSQIASFFQEATEACAKRQDMPTKHLRLFSTFIRGENVVMKENQKHIFWHFFNNEHNEFNTEGIDYTFKFKVQYRTAQFEEIPDESNNKDRSKVVKVAFGREDPCSIIDFFSRYKENFNYLLNYVSLLADVCMDRNNQAIEYVEHNLPLAVVSNILFDDDIKNLSDVLKKQNEEQRLAGKGKRFQITNIYEPFIRIGHHAYVNNFKFSPILRIRKIVKWYKEEDEVSEIEDITRTKRVYEGEKEEEEKTYLKFLLAYIKKFLEEYDKTLESKDVSNLQILDTVLSFLKETILLGLWDSIQEFREIIPLLIKNMIKIECNIFFQGYDDNAKKRYSSGKDWVDAKKETLRMNRPQIALTIECKNKATEIFKYMNEMEIDIRLRYLMNFFQGIYEATENVEHYSDPIEDEVKVEALSQLQDEEQRINVTNRNQIAKEEFYKIFGTNILGEVKKYSEDQDMLMKEYLWYNKIKTMIPLEYDETVEDPDKDRDLFKNSMQDFPLDKIVLSLFELSGYMNKNLLNNSLNMLRAMFEQRSDIIESYKNLLICGKGNLSEVYLNLKFMRNKFAMLKNDIILSYDGNANKSFSYAIFKPYDHLGREEDKRSGIIQDLFFLARTLKDSVSLKNIQSLMNVDKQVFDKSIVYHFYNQKEKNNDLFQQLNMAEGIYYPLIDYIKIVGKEELPEIHRWLLFSIYQYLTLLCFNNMKAKHIFMRYIPDIIPHLNKRVGAASFLYEVCINNKILVNNEQLVSLIIDGALNSCLQLQKEELVHGLVSNAINQDLRLNNNFEKSRILYSLRGVLIFNDEGHKRNQQMLLNKLSDNKFRRLVFKDSLKYTAKKEDFNLSHAETYATTHFELFSAMVESENLINIGKLENLHPYLYCLTCLSETNRWQLRRALRSYVNRLYYVHKDKDIFMFEQFIRKEFSIINRELYDLIELHRSKMLTEQLKVKNGIRFCYAESEIILLILQILITLHEMFLKKKFRDLLLRELAKEEKLDDNKKKLHKTLIKLLRYLGCVNKLYSNTKVIISFIKEIKELMKRHILSVFPVRYLEKMSAPSEKEANEEEGVEEEEGDEEKFKKILPEGEKTEREKEEAKQKEKSQGKKGFSFDRSKTFFRNLINMMRSVKQQETYLGLQKEFLKSKNQMDVSEDDLKVRYIETIFLVPHESSLRSIAPIKVKQEEEYHYVQHLQTAHSKMFKLLAKPEYEENQENLELNSRLNNVKEMLTDSPAFKKLKQDEFYKLVVIFTSMDNISAENSTNLWLDLKEDPRPVFSKRQIIKNCFDLIINYPDIIKDSEKIFIIKLVRCYIAEAVEEKQNHKLSVDKWSADYYTDETNGADILAEEKSELVRRQHEIEECGGSKLLLSIFKDNLFSKTELLNEALLLGIIYLYNGNTHCQNSILKELTNDPNNATFISLRLLIKNIGNFLIEVRKFKDNEKERDFSYKIVDSYDHFDQKESVLVKMFGHKTDKFQIQTQLNYELALCRTFRFLQLFCENNNIDMKKFLMSQTNEDGKQKDANINFIQEACQLLRQLFKIMSSKVVNIPPSILDFINEITQIPCLNCQKSLMRSTFFEDISYMASFFQDKNNVEQRKFNFFLDPETASDDDPLNTLADIYGKGIGLALSNFEGNDSEIFWEFLNKCQPLFLWIVIRQNMIKLLRPMADKFKVSREAIEKELEEYINGGTLQNRERDQLIQFREYHVEYKFIRKIFQNFGDRAIIKFISEHRAAGEEFGQEICNIINVLSILKKIDDYAEQREKDAVKDPEQINTEQNEKALKARSFREELKERALADGYTHINQFIALFEELLLSIEISSDNGEVVSFQNVYFPKHPVFSYLAADTRDTIMFDVGRDTRRDKLITLQGYYQQLKEEIKWCYRLNYYNTNFLGVNFSMSITSQYIDQIRKTARYISYGICALMLWLIVVEHDTTEKESYFTFFHYNEKLIMRIVCTLQLMLTLLFFGLWIKMRLNLCLSKLQKQQQQQGGGEEEGGEEEEEGGEEGEAPPPPEGIIEKVIFYAIYVSQYFFKVMGSVKKIGKRLKKIFYDDMMSLYGFRHLSILVHFFLDPIFNFFKSIGVGFYALLQFQSGFLSILIFVIASIMGNFVGIEWYVIHLFDYFVGISLLTNVFKAVINNIGQLSLLSTFAACFILVFNILSLNTYTSVIYQDDIPGESCAEIIGCVLQVYTSGAIGDDMDKIYPDRFTFDTIYFIFMEILFSNLISGIMIDGFGSLKEADAERDDDKYNKCYICSMEKPDMEKKGTTFKKHTSKHFLWNYLFYRYVLEMKDASDYTGLEYSISTQITESKIDWFPDNGPKDEGGAIEELMGSLKEKMIKMSEDVNSFIDKQTSEITTNSSEIHSAIENKKNLMLPEHVMEEPAPLEV